MILRDLAYSLGRKGYHVFPVNVSVREDGQKTLRFPAGGWKDIASPSAYSIGGMPWDEATHIGLHCEASGLVVVDLDDFDREYEDGTFETIRGEELFHLYQDEVERPDDRDDGAIALPSMSGNGIHIFYRADPDHPVTSSVKRVASFVDIRAEGGLLIAGCPEEMPPVDDLPYAPAWLAEASKAPDRATPKAPPREHRYAPGEDSTAYGKRALQAELARLQEAWDRDDGAFNDTLNQVAFAIGQLVSGGELDEEFAYGALEDWLTDAGAPNNQRKTLDSGFWSGFDHPRSATDGEGHVTDEQITAMRSELLDEQGIQALPPPEWLVPGWIETNSVVHLIGAAGSGKTFVTLDMAACVGSGRAWPEHRDAAHTPRLVVYVIAEAAHGVGKRVRAWNTKYGSIGEVKFLPRPVRIGERNDYGRIIETDEWRVFAATVKQMKPAMIVFDTQARVTVGIEENSAKEMGVIVRLVERLQRDTGAAVVMVHHTGKGENPTARGSSAMIGAVSTEILVYKRKDGIFVKNTKQKNDKEADAIRFEPEEVEDSIVLNTQGRVSDAFSSRRRQSVRAVLRDSPEPMSIGDISKVTGIDKAGVRVVINWMVAEGYVTQEGGVRGGNPATLYRWSPNPETSD